MDNPPRRPVDQAVEAWAQGAATAGMAPDVIAASRLRAGHEARRLLKLGLGFDAVVAAAAAAGEHGFASGWDIEMRRSAEAVMTDRAHQAELERIGRVMAESDGPPPSYAAAPA